MKRCARSGFFAPLAMHMLSIHKVAPSLGRTKPIGALDDAWMASPLKECESQASPLASISLGADW